MALIGYASTSYGEQVNKLTSYGCTGDDNKIFIEKKSGANYKQAELQACLNHLSKGDTLVITKFDRLAHSIFHLAQIAADLKRREIKFVVLDLPEATDQLLFNILASIEEFDAIIRKGRKTDNTAKIQNRDIELSTKQKLTREQLIELKAKRESGVLVKDLMNEYGLRQENVDRLLND